MKSLLPLFLVLSSLSVNVLGYGPRGRPKSMHLQPTSRNLPWSPTPLTVTRILYYYAYLADGKLLDAAVIQQPSIAPGCQGANGRCTFIEFCDHIWKAKGNEPRPANVAEYPKMAGKSFETIDIAAVYNMIVAEKKNNKARFGLMTSNIEAKNLVPSASTYYDALATVAGPIGSLGNTNPTDDVSKNIVKNGRGAAGLVHELRLQDLDKFRPKALADILGVSEDDIKTKNGPNGYKVTGNYQILDPSATAQHLADTKYNGDKAQAMQALGDAHKEWLSKSDSGNLHFQAFSSAESSLTLSSCSRS